MSTTLGTRAPRARSARPPVRITPAARRLLERFRAEGGDVALFLSPGRDEVLCLGRRDVTLGPNDLLIGDIGGAPVYVDRRADPAALAALVLDVERDLLGLRFVLRPPGP